MNYIYPAVFYPEGDGKYSVIFPDLNDLATYGDNLADAFAMAQEACGQYLFTSLRDGDVLPAPTPLDAVEKDEDAARPRRYYHLARKGRALLREKERAASADSHGRAGNHNCFPVKHVESSFTLHF